MSSLPLDQVSGVKNPLKHKKGGWLYEEFLVRVPQINRGDNHKIGGGGAVEAVVVFGLTRLKGQRLFDGLEEIRDQLTS